MAENGSGIETWKTVVEFPNYEVTAIQRRVQHQDWQSIEDKQSYRVMQCEKDGTPIREWKSMIECERKTGIKCAGISKCCSGHLKTYRGYKWKRC